jgi:hypothetical protein
VARASLVRLRLALAANGRGLSLILRVQVRHTSELARASTTSGLPLDSVLLYSWNNVPAVLLIFIVVYERLLFRGGAFGAPNQLVVV